MAGSTATCAGGAECDVIGGYLGVSPGTSITGNFEGNIAPTADGEDCATNGLHAWQKGRAMTGDPMLAEMGGETFGPGVHVHGSAINIALTNPLVYLDANGDPDAKFVFNVATTLTTCAESEIVLLNSQDRECLLDSRYGSYHGRRQYLDWQCISRICHNYWNKWEDPRPSHRPNCRDLRNCMRHHGR